MIVDFPEQAQFHHCSMQWLQAYPSLLMGVRMSLHLYHCALPTYHPSRPLRSVSGIAPKGKSEYCSDWSDFFTRSTGLVKYLLINQFNRVGLLPLLDPRCALLDQLDK